MYRYLNLVHAYSTVPGYTQIDLTISPLDRKRVHRIHVAFLHGIPIQLWSGNILEIMSIRVPFLIKGEI